MNKFLYHFDKTISSSLYLALVALVVCIYFGSGIYASYRDRHAERSDRAEYAKVIDEHKTLKRQLSECKTGQHCIVAGRELVTITAKGAK